MAAVRRGALLRRRAAGVLLALSLPVGVLTACGSDETAPESSTTAAPTPSARPIDPASCTETPPKGEIDRSGQRLAFRSGNIKIAIASPTSGPARPSTPAADDASDCYEFDRWGPEKPDVPPDSLLFVFKGAGTDGAQIEFLVSELTGGILPPVGNSPGTRPGALTKPINAQIGVSVDGVYHRASSCQLSVTGMSDKLAAGSFSCPTATRENANPFAPNDDVSFDDESSSRPSAPRTGSGAASSETVSLLGWFQLTP